MFCALRWKHFHINKTNRKGWGLRTDSNMRKSLRAFHCQTQLITIKIHIL